MFDRHTFADFLLALLQGLQGEVCVPTQPERVPEVPEPLTPLERLEAEAAELGVEVHDFRGWPRDKEYDWREWGWPPNKKRGRSRGKRSWDQVTAICLHTYGVSGVSWKRYLGVPAHGGVDTDGHIVLCHDQTEYLWHGNAANRFSTGIEIAGVSGFDNPRQVKSARALMRYYSAEQRRNRTEACPAGDRVAVMGHSMAEKGKPLCPGLEIWEALGQWSIQEGLCVMGPVVGTGSPLPAP